MGDGGAGEKVGRKKREELGSSVLGLGEVDAKGGVCTKAPCGGLNKNDSHRPVGNGGH